MDSGSQVHFFATHPVLHLCYSTKKEFTFFCNVGVHTPSRFAKGLLEQKKHPLRKFKRFGISQPHIERKETSPEDFST